MAMISEQERKINMEDTRSINNISFTDSVQGQKKRVSKQQWKEQ
jgi:hypothetical protein